MDNSSSRFGQILGDDWETGSERHQFSLRAVTAG